MRLSKGRLSTTGPIPTGLLEVRGARTGELRRTALIYFHDGDKIILIASRAGDARHPGWYYNVLADPDVRFAGQPFRAVVVEDEAERMRLWRLADAVFPPFADYRRSAGSHGREIPIVQLQAV